ncbi:MAG: hypothetical protein CR991_06405 [Proteobacteria bacterium]|nr:MAG: hypothetical protein CR991_06405 [Pseudomonadota bacterium]
MQHFDLCPETSMPNQSNALSKEFEILMSFGIKANQRALEGLISNFGSDPLTLHLLGAYLKRWYAGRLNGLESIPILNDPEVKYRGLRRILAAFQLKLHGTSDLTLLYLLSLSEQPVSQQALQLVFRSTLLKRWLSRHDEYQRFLTPLSRLNDKHWHWVIENLRRLQLLELEVSDEATYLLVPKPIRQFFYNELITKQYDVFQQAQADIARLFEDNIIVGLDTKRLNSSSKSATTSLDAKELVRELLWKKDELNHLCKNLSALRDALAALRQHGDSLKQGLSSLNT